VNKSGTNAIKKMLLLHIQVLTKKGYVLHSGRNRPLYRNIHNARRYGIAPEVNNLIENISKTNVKQKFDPSYNVGVTCCLGNYGDINLQELCTHNFMPLLL
jgi:hypothetical protein